MSSLDVWGLDDVAEIAYRAMLRNPDLNIDELARHLELDRDQAAAAVDELLRVGLVSRTVTGLVPAPPATTLGSLLHGELRDLEERRAQLEAVRATLSGFAADHMVGQSRGWSSMPFELLSPDEAFVVVEDIQRGTTGEVLSCHPAVDIDVDSPTYVASSSTSSRPGGRCAGCTPPRSSTTRPAWSTYDGGPTPANGCA